MALNGGKNYLAKRIIELMPPRCKNPNAPAADDSGWLHYVEPYAGGLSVLLANDPEGISEVVNDRHKELTIFWAVLQGEDTFAGFQRLCEATPFSQIEWDCGDYGAYGPNDNDSWVVRAWRFFVRCRQSMSGRMDSFAPLTRNRTRRGMNEQASAWLNCIEGLPAVHARLKRVVVFNKDALEVIRQQDGPRTLFYLDPPYLHETRASTGEYAHEMTYQQHRDLLELLKTIKGRFLLSGYDSDLYRGYSQTVPRWNKHEFEISNHAASGDTKRRMTECVWTNF